MWFLETVQGTVKSPNTRGRYRLYKLTDIGNMPNEWAGENDVILVIIILGVR
jgi:hypothetical protein